MKIRITGLILIVMCGCHSIQTAAPILDAKKDTSSTDIILKQVRWKVDYADKSSMFTERTYQCISEMYSLAYTPVDNGPVCRESCKLFAEVNSFVDSAPIYIENPQRYSLKGKGGICEKKYRKWKQ
jgi:hypothetical protein